MTTRPRHADIAAHLGVSRAYVSRVLLAGGILPPDGSLDECRVAFIRHLRAKVAAPQSDLNTERARLYHHKANAAAIEETETRAGLVRAEHVEGAIAQAFDQVRARLDELPGKVAESVIEAGSDAATVRSVIEAEVLLALDDLSRLASE
jgi:hypothetical protein